MGALKLIIKREYAARVRNKSFIVMTFLSPLILIGMFFLIGYLTQLNNDGTRTILLVDESGLLVPEFKNGENLNFQDFSAIGIDKTKELVAKDGYYGLIYVPKDVKNNPDSITFYGEEVPSFSVIDKIEEVIEKTLTDEKLLDKGVDLDIIEDAKTAVSIHIENFTGEETSKLSNWIKAALGGATGYLLMMFIIIYGNMVMRSVIEEKTNRIVEVIISSVKPFQLMMGKIIGTTLAGITQFTIWILIISALLFGLTTFLGIDVSNINTPASSAIAVTDVDKIELILLDILRLPLLKMAVFFLIYFIGGYFLYSSIYAAIGAAVDSETDTQQFIFPLIMPLMLAIYVGFFAVIENPHGTVSTAFSFIPLTSPIVMLMRIPFGVPWWHLLISVVLLIASFLFTVWFGSKIYKVGILMYGKKPSYKELIKWLKY